MIDISHALTVQGWSGELELSYLAEVARNSSFVAEIGCWKGRSTCAIAANVAGIVYAVDTWRGSAEHQSDFAGKDEDWLFKEFLENTYPVQSTTHPIRMKSTNAAWWLSMLGRRLDMVFLDASHDYESVKADILAWTPLLANGGIICGHDHTEHWPGVVQAVSECVPKFRIVESTSIWTTEGA